MLITCPHCQGYTEISPVQIGLITCRICTQTFSPGHDPLFGDDDGPDVTMIRQPKRSLLQSGRVDPISHTAPPQSVDFANLTGDNFEALGGLSPTNSMESIDFDALAADTGEGIDLSLLVKTGRAPVDDESTVAFNAEQASGIAEQLRAILTLPPEPEAERAQDRPTIWRVRSARGLVYELMSLDAVVAWLEGKADVSGVRIASGSGEFRPISAHPELARRVSGRDGGAELGLADLPLTLDERPIVTSAPPSAQMHAVSPLRRDADAPVRAARAADPDDPIGFAGVIGIAVLTALLIGGSVFLGVRSGWLDEMIPPAPPAAQAPASPELAAAIASYEAKNLTAAIAGLRRLARTSDDPRVHRYLTLALHRQQRHQEAREALARYQTVMDPSN
ncbi:MAG: hypothetical protein ACI9U2_000187 [Bradymonadia bacterium]|jgi:hypothetical protein